EEIEGFGIVEISGNNKEGMDAAKEYILGISQEPEIGKIYKAKVKSIVEFGAFCEFLPQKDGLLHISEIAWERVEKVGDYLKEGDTIEVKLIGIEKGKFKLSKKVLTERPARPAKPEEQK
ncbi:MAG: S1 RNA-binding domain-containing protein, partial [Bacteroidales bacterium]|nr:S1 RNA-binding domain-containing protein [Bacteroidales bacterium]